MLRKSIDSGPMGVLEGRKRPQQSSSQARQAYYDPEDPWMGFNQPAENDSDEDSEEDLEAFEVVSPTEHTQSSLAFDLIGGEDPFVVAEERQRRCQKRAWKVDVAELGWDEWIIAPKTFDVGHCSGSCHDLAKAVGAISLILDAC